MLRKVMLSLVAVCFVVSCSNGAYLLSGNSHGFIIPFGTPTINTGADYEWLTGAGSGQRGSTDAQIVSTDELNSGYWDMQDGIGASSGAYGVFSSWGGETAATAQFDLKDVYSISSVLLSLDWKSGGAYPSISAFEVWTSEDGNAFTKWAEWDGTAPASSKDARITLSSAAASARYVQFFTKRGAYQQVLGQMAIYGDVVPEPATLVLLGLGAVSLLKGRKQ